MVMMVVVVVTGANGKPGIDEFLLREKAERHLHLSQEAVGHDGALLVEKDVDYLRGTREGGREGGRKGRRGLSFLTKLNL